ncbi:hypothetical protein WELLINGTON_205 [Erwinia phage Wellington]|jgi:hypothetical protein|uniref:Uncharacterized protein n=2 Tax=Wellingtonvirus wellington TaxID=2734153 RepID=A0A1B2IE69_9CAUD|nr:hypothetical protein BIZ80_gp093 [Erwinia phage vB_EamM_Kwan]YP_009806689.1 hypothetical protein HOT70_gp096 [Erwinia phage Wellington]ANZ49558.1 hypothetical protein KWAN_206 [Erwinia phage vB_EamM_Kwan]AXF51333.1 hypothetical protein WELLINGTON_205 [Erwinia phage Wellington]
MTDIKLIAMLETLTSLKTNSYMKVRVEISEDEYKTLVKNAFIKAYLDKTFPEQIKVLDEWVATPTNLRDASKKPFWPRAMTGRMPQRVVWFYKDGDRLKGKIIGWDAPDADIDICPVGECQQPTFVGALYPYNNPSTGYLTPVFVDGVVPPYYHELAIWQTEQGLNVMRSSDGYTWGDMLEA